jgi:abortive infection bacteriophage resistance protein
MVAMAKSPFTKIAYTPAQILTKLVSQGLTVPAAYHKTAIDYLQHVGGYRLKGYWHHMLVPGTNQFSNGTTFSEIVDQCEFDRELRAATIAAIDRLEVSIRSSIANYLSLKHSPHWFLTPSIFKPNDKWGMGKLIQKIESEVGRSNQKSFIKHYNSQHDEPYLPPSWAITECVSFGFWSRTYAILRDNNDKKVFDPGL